MNVAGGGGAFRVGPFEINVSIQEVCKDLYVLWVHENECSTVHSGEKLFCKLLLRHNNKNSKQNVREIWSRMYGPFHNLKEREFAPFFTVLITSSSGIPYTFVSACRYHIKHSSSGEICNRYNCGFRPNGRVSWILHVRWYSLKYSRHSWRWNTFWHNQFDYRHTRHVQELGVSYRTRPRGNRLTGCRRTLQMHCLDVLRH